MKSTKIWLKSGYSLESSNAFLLEIPGPAASLIMTKQEPEQTLKHSLPSCSSKTALKAGSPKVLRDQPKSHQSGSSFVAGRSKWSKKSTKIVSAVGHFSVLFCCCCFSSLGELDSFPHWLALSAASLHLMRRSQCSLRSAANAWVHSGYPAVSMCIPAHSLSQAECYLFIHTYLIVK